MSIKSGPDPRIPKSVDPKRMKRPTHKTIEMAIKISTAFAQLALLGFVPPPNDHTKNMMMFTNGIADTSRVMIQSPVEITGVGLFSGVSIMGWFSLFCNL